MRINSEGQLQNINGLRLVSGGASVVGGLNNNNGGITKAGDVSGVKTLTAQRIEITGVAFDNLLQLTQNGEGVFTIFNNGALELRSTAENAFIVKDGNGEDFFSVNTAGGLVKVGSEQNTTAVLLVLDNATLDSDPEGVNGAQYYNSRVQKFRCFQNGVWRDCISPIDSEYLIATQPFSWYQPDTDSEIPTRQRAWVDLSQAVSYRTIIQVDNPGVETSRVSSCSFTTNPIGGVWYNLDKDDKYMGISEEGVLKTDWKDIIASGHQEVLIRVMCRGGDSTARHNGQQVEISSIRFQVR